MTHLVTASDIRSAAMSNATYLRNELNDEVAGHYPQWQQWLELLRRIDRRYFDGPAFHQQCARSKDLVGNFTPVQILEFMFHFGIIGFARTKPAKSHKFLWSYRNAEIPFDSNAPTYAVHAGLLPYLQSA
jgi:hypothetical protein